MAVSTALGVGKMKVGDLVKYTTDGKWKVGVLVGSEEWVGNGGLIIWKVQNEDGIRIHFERHLEKIG